MEHVYSVLQMINVLILKMFVSMEYAKSTNHPINLSVAVNEALRGTLANIDRMKYLNANLTVSTALAF